MRKPTSEKSNSFLKSLDPIRLSNSLSFIAGIALIGMIVSSCGLHIEKRRYTKGYSISLNKKLKSSEESNSDHQAEIFIESSADESFREQVLQTREDDRINTENSFEETNSIVASGDLVNTIQNLSQKPDLKTVSSKVNNNKKIQNSHSEHRVIQISKNTETSGSGDAQMFILAGLVCVSSAAFIRKKRKTTLKYTRWANKNRIKSRSLIVLGQFGLGFIGYSLGGHLKDFGYEISETSSYLISGLTSATFLGMYLKEQTKRNMWDLNAFFREKTGHVILSACLLGSSMSIGNGVASNLLQQGTMGELIESHYNVNNNKAKNIQVKELSHGTQHTFEKAAQNNDKKVVVLIVFYIIFAVLLTILLAILSCAAVCAYGEIGLLMLLASILFLVAYNFAMNRWIRELRNR